jgi:hypothetical protein
MELAALISKSSQSTPLVLDFPESSPELEAGTPPNILCNPDWIKMSLTCIYHKLKFIFPLNLSIPNFKDCISPQPSSDTNCWEIDNKLATNFSTALYVKDKFELKIHKNTHQCGK